MEKTYISETELPVGYRFVPTDEELVADYLLNKARSRPLPSKVIQDVDASLLFDKPPYMNLGSISKSKETKREWYFFAYEDRIEKRKEIQVGDGKGCWKAASNEEPIYNEDEDVCAFKLQFIFYSGPKFTKQKKTQWKMDKYILPKHRWILLRLSNGLVDYNT